MAIGPIHGPKWPKERSPGFTLGSSPHPELALKGPRDTATIGSARLNRTACVCLAPSGRNVYFRLTQGTVLRFTTTLRLIFLKRYNLEATENFISTRKIANYFANRARKTTHECWHRDNLVARREFWVFH